MRFRYPRSRRLRKRRDFTRVQDAGVRVTTPHFVLLAAKTPPASDVPVREHRKRSEGASAGRTAGLEAAPAPCRLGVVASKKVGGAVQRNRAKRLLREVFRAHPELFPAGVDLVVIARPGAPDQSFSTVHKEIVASSAALARAARQALSRPDRTVRPREVLRK